MSYNIFADYYDVLMQNVGYKERSDYICELMKRHNHEFGITLDLACGTGSLTTELALKGIDVYGIDASAEMLSEAMQKSSEKGLNILYLKQKMQNLNLYGTIDTCICTLDSINHITKEEDVTKAFERVAFFMDKDGLFVFDVNTVYKDHKQQKGSGRRRIRDDTQHPRLPVCLLRRRQYAELLRHGKRPELCRQLAVLCRHNPCRHRLRCFHAGNDGVDEAPVPRGAPRSV